MNYRPYLEFGALRQMNGLPEQAFDMLVTLLARRMATSGPIMSPAMEERFPPLPRASASLHSTGCQVRSPSWM